MKALSVSLVALSVAMPVVSFGHADDTPASNPVNAGDGERPYGIEERVPWSTSKIVGSPEPPPPYIAERRFPFLQFIEPVDMASAPGSDRLFVTELAGRILTFPKDNEVKQPDLFFDMKKEIPDMTRVYGLTFHPEFEHNRYCYICYIVEPDQQDGTRVSRFQVSRTDPPQVDPASEKVIITWRSGGHNGGCLKFGPDGCLYISAGDAGPAFPPDPYIAGQDLTNLLCTIMRIDVNREQDGRPYTIPEDNPFVDVDGARGEIWCYGLRNPWKMSFDSVTGDLWVGDVGWEMWEMLYRVQPGGNYGWSRFEGRQPALRDREQGPTPILPPTIDHSHTEARSITGGYVYHGTRLKELVGAYIYGDWMTGKLWATRMEGDRVASTQELVDTPLQIICFGVDQDNELYIVGYDGTIHWLQPNIAAKLNPDFPKRLSETGLFASVEQHEVAPGVIPYSINAEPWSDYATAERFLALPKLSQLGIYEHNDWQRDIVKGNMEFPADTVLAKTIFLAMQRGNVDSRRRLETQILHLDGETWRGHTYIWNDDQSDAVLCDAKGEDQTFSIQDPQLPSGTVQQHWHFPSRSECFICHTAHGGTVKAFRVEQLNRDRDHRHGAGNQLQALVDGGFFKKPPDNVSARMPSPYDPSSSLLARARAYLHVNCSHCHQRGGGGTSPLDVPYHIRLADANLIDQQPTQGSFDISDARIVAPGDPYRSVLYYRMAKLGRGRMPYFGSNFVDEQGLALMFDWIAQLQPDALSDDSYRLAAERRAEQQQTLAQIRSTTELTHERRGELMDELLATTSGALLLMQAQQAGRLEQPIQDELVSRATAGSPPVRDLFERFLPEEARIKRLGTAINPDDILLLNGDVDRGRQMFASPAGLQCKNCHRVGDVGQEIGPDLDQIGARLSKAQLLESILVPSRAIDPKYSAYLVETEQGPIHVGMLLERTEEQILLKDAQGKEIRIPAESVEYLEPQKLSIMPELLLSDMTAEQAADLLAFLASLK